MSDAATWSLTLDQQELHLLTQLLRLPPMPFQGKAPGSSWECTEQQLGQIGERLVNRGLVVIRDDGSWVVDVAIAMLLASAVSATHTVVVLRPSSASLTCMHSTSLGCSIMVDEQASQNGSRVTLTAVRDARTLVECVRGFLRLPEVPVAPGPRLVLRRERLHEMSCLALGGDEHACTALASEAGMDTSAAGALVAALAQGGMGSLMALDCSGPTATPMDGLAWIAGNRGAWVVERSVDEPSTVTLVPASSATIAHRIQEKIEHYC